MLKVEGLMPGKCMMFDTPGVPHAHQLTALLQPEEVHRPPAAAAPPLLLPVAACWRARVHEDLGHAGSLDRQGPWTGARAELSQVPAILCTRNVN